MESEKSPAPLDLFELLNRLLTSLRKLWIPVLVLTVLVSGFMCLRARRSFTPMYESTALFSVSSGYSTDDIFSSASSYYDNAAAQSMAESFPHLLNTDMMRDLILVQLDKGYINGSISAASIAETNLFELTVRSSDPQDAYDILCAVIDSYPQVAVHMIDNPNIIVRQPPTLAGAPYNSFSATGSAARGAILGLALGLLLVCLHTLLVRPVLTSDELTKLVNLPLLASLPHVSVKKRRNNQRSFLRAEENAALNEALRGLRTKICRHLSDHNGKIILLTSSLPGEGKSTIAANLALSLASGGQKVVLVDADLRKQSIGRMLGRNKRQAGLMDCLRNSKLSVLENLSTVPDSQLYYLSGASTGKQHYSIDPKAMNRILKELTSEFDYVVLDTPPSAVISDTALLCRHADCVVYVVKQGLASQSQILDSVTGLYDQGAPLLGCVFNDVPRSRIRRGYGYGYGYGSKYGYGKNKKFD